MFYVEYREDLFITNGASVGVWDVFSWFFRAGDTIFVEDPTYKAMLPGLESSEVCFRYMPTFGAHGTRYHRPRYIY